MGPCAKKMWIQAKKTCSGAKKACTWANISKLYFSKGALRSDFYIKKISTPHYRAVSRIVHLAGVHLAGCYCISYFVLKEWYNFQLVSNQKHILFFPLFWFLLLMFCKILYKIYVFNLQLFAIKKTMSNMQFCSLHIYPCINQLLTHCAFYRYKVFFSSFFKLINHSFNLLEVHICLFILK